MCAIIKIRSPLTKKRATRTEMVEPFSPPAAPINDSQPFGFMAISDRNGRVEESFLAVPSGVSDNSDNHSSDYDSYEEEK